MGVKPITRAELISQILDFDEPEISARALVRGFPSVVTCLEDLVEMVCPLKDPSVALFNVLADAYDDVYPIEGESP